VSDEDREHSQHGDEISHEKDHHYRRVDLITQKLSQYRKESYDPNGPEHGCSKRETSRRIISYDQGIAFVARATILAKVEVVGGERTAMRAVHHLPFV
jgi:hypothetical protein